MNVFIVEDEPLAVKKLQRLLNETAPDLHIVGTAGSIRASVEWLENNPAPDLIFLDIELSDGQSFEVFQRVPVKSPVIFTTSYDEFALKAFKVNSVDYLLKPLQRDDLAQAIEKYRNLKEQYVRDSSPIMSSIESLLQSLSGGATGGGGTKEYRTRFLVKHLQKLVSVEVEDIAYFWSEGRINFFKVRSGQKYMVDYTLDEIEEMVSPKDWFRVSRQFIVSVPSVQEIHPFFNNRLKLHLLPKEPEDVFVSRERVNDFKIWLGK
jgi:two-component system, LytTR family, response regulator LytT